jgi:hypothetical protein
VKEHIPPLLYLSEDHKVVSHFENVGCHASPIYGWLDERSFRYVYPKRGIAEQLFGLESHGLWLKRNF